MPAAGCFGTDDIDPATAPAAPTTSAPPGEAPAPTREAPPPTPSAPRASTTNASPAGATPEPPPAAPADARLPVEGNVEVEAAAGGSLSFVYRIPARLQETTADGGSRHMFAARAVGGPDSVVSLIYIRGTEDARMPMFGPAVGLGETCLGLSSTTDKAAQDVEYVFLAGSSGPGALSVQIGLLDELSCEPPPADGVREAPVVGGPSAGSLYVESRHPVAAFGPVAVNVELADERPGMPAGAPLSAGPLAISFEHANGGLHIFSALVSAPAGAGSLRAALALDGNRSGSEGIFLDGRQSAVFDGVGSPRRQAVGELVRGEGLRAGESLFLAAATFNIDPALLGVDSQPTWRGTELLPSTAPAGTLRFAAPGIEVVLGTGLPARGAHS